jgi:hypothetical protein
MEAASFLFVGEVLGEVDIILPPVGQANIHFWSWAGRTIASAQQTLDQASKKAEQVAQGAQEAIDCAAGEAQKAVQDAAVSATRSVPIRRRS